MAYRGNPSLGDDVKERISSTYEQSLELASQGKEQEALLGCEFILRLDPEFSPARSLLERLRGDRGSAPQEEPVAAPGPGTGGTAAPVGADTGQFDQLGDLEGLDELGDLEELEAGDQPVAPAVAGAEAERLRALFEARDYRAVVELAEGEASAVAADPQLAPIVAQARSRLESQPYVETFVQSARKAIDGGDAEEAARLVDKARALDPSHPELASLSGSPPAEAAEDGTAADDDLKALQMQTLSLGSGEYEPELFDDGPPGGLDDLADDLDDDSDDDLDDDLGLDELEADEDDGLGLEVDGEELAGEAIALDDDSGAEQLPALSEGDDPTPEAPPADDLGAAASDDLPGIEEELDDAFDNALEAGSAVEATALDDASGPAGAAAAPDSPPPSEEPAAEVAASDETAGELGDLGTALDEGGEASSDSERISQLLAEGQEAFERGEYQTSIDLWSRIFLIDLDHEEASRRIEEARNKKAELERKAEELFHEAVDQLEKGAADDARGVLQQVLELQPSHSIARDYLDQLEAGKVPTVAKRHVEHSAEAALGGDEGAPDLSDMLVETEGDRSLDAAVQRDRVVAVKRTDRRLLLIGAAVLLAAIGGGAYLVMHWDRLFPNAEPTETSVGRRVPDAIERATTMHEGGNTENAILLLRRIQPQDPLHEQAQALIAQWEALVASPGDATAAGPSDELVEQRRLLVEAATQAHESAQNIRAVRYLERAAQISPLNANELTLRRRCESLLEPLAEDIELYEEGEYTQILPRLWRRRESNPENKDIQLLMVNSYYNLALRDLQRGDATTALEKLREGLELDADDPALRRMLVFAETYNNRSPDLLYRIYVKYLPSRS